MSKFTKEFDDILGDLVKKSKSVTYVCFVMDHSGSMGTCATMARESFNEQLKILQENPDKEMQTLVSIIEFDFTVKPINKNKLVDEIKPMNNYWIGGTTAYYDAIAIGISTIRSLMDRDPREDKAALMLIQSDGEENASQDFAGTDGQKRLKELIKELEETGKWSFTFLAEGIDKEHVVSDLHAMVGNVMSYGKDARGYKMSLNSTKRGLGKYFASRKLGETQTMSFHGDDSQDRPGKTRKADEEYVAPMQRDGYEHK